MDAHWEALCAAGLPDGAGRSRDGAAAASLDAARAAVAALSRAPEGLLAWQREPLLAWLRAFAHEFPTRFARELGDDGARLTALLESQALDVNRYLKLRRIAAENLARYL